MPLLTILMFWAIAASVCPIIHLPGARRKACSTPVPNAHKPETGALCALADSKDD
jgi:hypothetical protein